MRNVRYRRPVYRFRRDKPTDDQPLGDFKGLIMDEKRPECRFRRNKLTDIGNTASGSTQSEIKSGLMEELQGAGRTKSEMNQITSGSNQLREGRQEYIMMQMFYNDALRKGREEGRSEGRST